MDGSDGVLTFRDIVVVPYSELLHHPSGGFHRGGPIWPDWDIPGFERHWHKNRAIDVRPIVPEDARDSDRDDLFWGGAVCGHFGHQIMDFSMRIMPSRWADPDATILFAGLQGAASPGWFFDLLSWFDLPRAKRLVLDCPTRFPRMQIVPQAERREQIGPSSRHLDLMDHFVETKSLDRRRIDAPVYVSRAGQVIKFGAERYLEKVVAQAGGIVFRPELHAIYDQMTTFLAADRLIFAEGSAMHLTSLAGRGFGDIDILIRRPDSQIGKAFLKPRARKLRFIDALSGSIHGLKPSGMPQITRGLPVLNQDKLIAYFEGIGLALGQYWKSFEFREDVLLDIRRWIDAELMPAQRAIPGYLDQVETTLSESLAGEPFLLEAARGMIEQKRWS